MQRCFCVNLKNPLYVAYHDQEWGVPKHDDHELYELLILESFQAGLSWECVLNKRENFRRAFDGFDPEKVKDYGQEKIDALAQDPGIIRNRRKLSAAVNNTRVFLEICREYGSFDRYLWGFTEGRVIKESAELHTSSPLSDRISADLKKRGMSFVGTVMVYSFLQAAGVINGHCQDCFLYPGPEDESRPSLT